MSHKKGLSRTDFSRIVSGSRGRWHGKLFTLVCGAVLGSADGPKIACVVSAKTAARAVDRNLIKRRCRAAAREEIRLSEKVSSYIFYARPTARGASYKDIKEDIVSLLEKVK